MHEPAVGHRPSIVPHMYLFTTMILFGSAFASSKVAVGQLDHQAAAALRFAGGAAVLLAVLLAARGLGRPASARDHTRAGMAGLLGVFAYNFLFFWGLSLAPAIDGGIIVPVLSPVLTTAVLMLTRRETPSTARIVGLALGVVGAAVFLIGTGEPTTGGSRLVGDLAFLLAAGCWAVYSIVSKKILAGVDPLRATASGTVAGAAALLVVGAPSLVQTDWTALSGTTWGNLAYLAIGPTAVAYLLYSRALRTVNPSTATVTMFVVPVVGTLCSVLFLGESMTAVQIVGSAVMMVGALLAIVRRLLPPSHRSGRSRRWRQVLTNADSGHSGGGATSRRTAGSSR